MILHAQIAWIIRRQELQIYSVIRRGALQSLDKPVGDALESSVPVARALLKLPEALDVLSLEEAVQMRVL